MNKLILDSTWSYRFRYLVYLKNREQPALYYPAEMARFTDEDIKKEYKVRMDAIHAALTCQGKLFCIGPCVFKTNELQSISLKLDLINEMNRGKTHNDYPPMILDILQRWYEGEEVVDESI